MTPQMKAALDFIRAYIDHGEGVSPSYEEIAVAIDVSSKGNVARILQSLKERGLIDYLPNRARSIRLINDPPRAWQMAAWSSAELSRVRADAYAILDARHDQPPGPGLRRVSA